MTFALPPPRDVLIIVWHTLAIYTALIVGLRLAGRRQLGQLTVIDLVIIIIMGSAVETAMVAGNTRLYAGLVCAGTLFAMNRLFTFLMLRSRRLRHLVSGGPVLLVHDGHFVEEHLKREGLTEEDVMEAIRERGEDSLENIRFAVMEADSTINVVPRDAHPSKPGVVDSQKDLSADDPGERSTEN